MITPTIGRVVWYWPHSSLKNVSWNDKTQPLAAHVAYVHCDTRVNLLVIDQNGVAHSVCSVLLHQGEAARPEGGFAEWMPYQKGQAAKTETLEKALAS